MKLFLWKKIQFLKKLQIKMIFFKEKYFLLKSSFRGYCGRKEAKYRSLCPDNESDCAILSLSLSGVVIAA